MSTDTATKRRELIPILWTLVMMQGGFVLLIAIASVVAFGFSGPGAIVPFALSLGATVVTFMAAKGLRRTRRWARRLTIVAEWYLIVFAVLDTGLTLFLASSLPPIIPLLTGLVIPAVVLRLLRLTKPLFEQPTDLDAKPYETSDRHAQPTVAPSPRLDALI